MTADDKMRVVFVVYRRDAHDTFVHVSADFILSFALSKMELAVFSRVNLTSSPLFAIYMCDCCCFLQNPVSKIIYYAISISY